MKTLTLALACLSPLTAHAVDTSPIPVRNSLPIIEGSGLNAPRAARLSALGSLELNVISNIESHASDSGSGFETLIIDGEQHSLALKLDWSFAEGWQGFVGLQALRNTPGSFDNAIDAWHDFFNLDDGDRAEQAKNQLLFFYEGAEGTARLSESNSAIGDLQLGISRQLLSSQNFDLALHGEANLPNGKTMQALGSDKTDLSFSIAASGSANTIGWHSNLGMVAIGDNALFAVPTKPSTWFSSLGAHWQASPKWRWSAQLDGHGPILDSRIKELEQDSWQLAVAAERRQSNSALQIYFTEDISVNSAADFSFGITLKYSLR